MGCECTSYIPAGRSAAGHCPYMIFLFLYNKSIHGRVLILIFYIWIFLYLDMCYISYKIQNK
jgi:hypothetical protein